MLDMPVDHPCDVCKTLYGNTAPNPTSKYCGICKKWICDRCRWSLGRLKVAGRDAFMRLVG